MKKKVPIGELKPGQWFFYNRAKWIRGVSKHPNPCKVILVRNAHITHLDANTPVTLIKVNITRK